MEASAPGKATLAVGHSWKAFTSLRTFLGLTTHSDDPEGPSTCQLKVFCVLSMAGRCSPPLSYLNSQFRLSFVRERQVEEQHECVISMLPSTLTSPVLLQVSSLWTGLCQMINLQPAHQQHRTAAYRSAKAPPPLLLSLTSSSPTLVDHLMKHNTLRTQGEHNKTIHIQSLEVWINSVSLEPTILHSSFSSHPKITKLKKGKEKF